jgi:LysM repeat protein
MTIPHYVYRQITFFVALSILVILLPSPTFPTDEVDYQVYDDFALPLYVDLCGERIALEDRNVFEMLDREFTIMVWDRAQVYMWLKRAGRYFPHIEKKLIEAEMPTDLKYLAVAESALLTNSRSRRGATGLWQFMSYTARGNGLRKDHMMDERRSFERSTEAALKCLKRLKRKFGTWALALAAYNCGEARLRKEIKKQKVKDYYSLNLPPETERFVFRIAAIKILMENPRRYGYNLSPERTYRPIEGDTVEVRIRSPLHMTNVARALGTDFKVLKELNPQILGYYMPTGHYAIKVPLGLGSKMTDFVKQPTVTPSRYAKKVSGEYYVVQPGDTLSHIALRTGVPVAKLRQLNGIEGAIISVGQKIQLGQ